LEEQAKYDHKKENESSFKSVMDTARMLSQGKTEKDVAEFLDIPLDKV